MDTKHISFTNNGQTYWVTATSRVENTIDFVQVRFSFEYNPAATDIEYVTVDNNGGNINMVTSRGNRFSSGYLYDELLNWFQTIVGSSRT